MTMLKVAFRNFPTAFKNIHSANMVHLWLLCGSQNKQRLFPYAALTDWFL